MDTRSSKLTDLKLVNKYYPRPGIANYSYPHSAKSSEQALAPTPTAAEPSSSSSPPPPAAAAAAAAATALAGRSSVGSEASVPGMVPDDRDSIISVDLSLSPLDGTERDSYHSSGAVLWDSFWEDPFWEARVDEDAGEAQVEGGPLSQRLMGNSSSSNGSYPALIPSPDEEGSTARKDGYFARIDSCSTTPAAAHGHGHGHDHGLMAGPEPAREPAEPAQSERQQSSKTSSPKRGLASQSATPKANTTSTYSLFPPSVRPASAKGASTSSHHHHHREQNTSPVSRNTMCCERTTTTTTAAWDDSLMIPAPLSLRKTPGRTTAHLKTADATTTTTTPSLALRSTWTHSTPAPAVVAGPLAPPPPLVDSSSWRDSAQSMGPAQRLPVPVPGSLCRARSDTVMSTLSVASSSHRRSGLTQQQQQQQQQQQHEVAPRPLPLIPPPVPPPPPPAAARRHQVRHSQPEVAVSPPFPQLALQRCMTEGQRSQMARNQGPPVHASRPCSTASSMMAPPSTVLVVTTTTRQVLPPAMPHPHLPVVSVFEEDSEDDEDDDGGRQGERSFARRIARSLTTSKRSRSASASATARSRKGYELAKVQLRRVRVGGGAGAPQSEKNYGAMTTTTTTTTKTTTTSMPVPQPPTTPSGEYLAKTCRDGEVRGPDARVLRKQKSEMFGRIFWGWH